MARGQRLLAAALLRGGRSGFRNVLGSCMGAGRRCLVTLLLCNVVLLAWSQRFFNLTYNDVRIDSVMPHFGYSIPLGTAYGDSVYSVEILYPEFVDATSADVARYKALRNAEVEAGRSTDNRQVDAGLPALPHIEQAVMSSRGKGFLSIGFCPLVYREGRWQWLVSFMLKVAAEQRPTQRPTPSPSRGEGSLNTLAGGGSSLKTNQDSSRGEGSLNTLAGGAPLKANRAPSLGENRGGTTSSVLATGRWAKIRVAETGVHQLTDDLIRQAGFSDINKVKVYGYGGNLQPEKLTQDYLQQTDDLQEVEQCVVGGRRLFYAKGPVSWSSNSATVRTRNPYSDYGYYFLTEGDPLTVSEEDFLASCYPQADDYHVLYESDGYAWFQGGRNLYETTPINAGSSKTYRLESAATGTTAQLSVTASAGVTSVVGVSCNGQDLGTITINVSPTYYEKGHATNRVFNLSDVQSTNEVTLTTQSGGPVRLDFISLTLASAKAAPSLGSDALPVPEYVYNITNQNLHGDSAVDMVIIIPTSQTLRPQAERLAEFHRERDGLRVRIVPADELYNEFSSGTPDATAYKRYLKMLYDRAETDADRPRYLLLFGDCAWDNRMLTSDWRMASPDDYLLCYESENSFSETYCYVSDEFFCLLDDGEALTTGNYPYESPAGLADMAVGRFPVTTESDAKVMVDKVIGYAENRNAGAWQNTLVFMGDDGNGNAHMRDVNDAAIETAQRHPGYQIRKVMWDAYTRETSSTGNSYPEVSKLVKQYQQQGALVMDYAGHGRADQVSHENVLRLADFQQFSNQNLPLWITASCDIMPYDGSTATIGETAVLNSKGGAIAFYGTARTVFVTQNKVMNMAFLRHVLTVEDGKTITLGEAQRRAKNEMISKRLDTSVNMLQYQLLGDPALSLNLPTAALVIDSINGIATDGTATQQAQLRAGSIARVVGHVADAPDFSGIVNATVRDSEETIVCKLNNTDKDGAQSPFTYTDRTKTLFNGSDSVRNGRFEISFAVPMDINYSDASGLINVHAVANDHQLMAHGANDRFLVGGSAAAGNDSIGPSIYCYLNSPSFVNGGNVNTTPYFVAELNDQDGINTSGNGIGHDLELIIDGEMSKTYVLNDNFQFDFGSYTSGSTYYNIPELAPGRHTLLFRAWDVLNNSSTAQLSFNVVKGLAPQLFSVSCTQNPARNSTTFIINHDRTGSTMDVTLDIFDTSGRQLWRHEESGISTDGAYTLPWNLTVDGGQRLQTGVYLYRVSVACDGSKKTSKAKKLVIIGNN